MYSVYNVWFLYLKHDWSTDSNNVDTKKLNWEIIHTHYINNVVKSIKLQQMVKKNQRLTVGFSQKVAKKLKWEPNNTNLSFVTFNMEYFRLHLNRLIPKIWHDWRRTHGSELRFSFLLPTSEVAPPSSQPLGWNSAFPIDESKFKIYEHETSLKWNPLL